MIPTINQENLHLFMPYKISKICCDASAGGSSIKETLVRFYKSNTSRLLHDESSKLWQLGVVALCEMYGEENE